MKKAATSGTAAPAKSAAKTAAKTAGKVKPALSDHAAAPASSRAKRSATPEVQLTEYRRKRDFTKTAEPAGSGPATKSSATKSSATKSSATKSSATKSSGSAARGAASSQPPRATRTVGELRFVIQKHAASHLHYDLRLEIDGVMKSWAVPKGPSADPKVRRLAMQVEDHPVEYNSFEGTIPAGEYGGGTVMLWDTGTYDIENAGGVRQNTAAHDEYERGELKLDFHGKRIQGSYALVRTKGNMRGNSNPSKPSKPSWLLIKHRDDHARPEQESDLTADFTTSVVSDRTMEEIGDGS